MRCQQWVTSQLQNAQGHDMTYYFGDITTWRMLSCNISSEFSKPYNLVLIQAWIDKRAFISSFKTSKWVFNINWIWSTFNRMCNWLIIVYFTVVASTTNVAFHNLNPTIKLSEGCYNLSCYLFLFDFVMFSIEFKLCYHHWVTITQCADSFVSMFKFRIKAIKVFRSSIQPSSSAWKPLWSYFVCMCMFEVIWHVPRMICLHLW